MADYLFHQATADFLAYLSYERRLSRHTLLAYENDLAQFRQFLKQQYDCTGPAAVQGIHIRAWLASLKDKGLANRSLKRKIATMNSFFVFLLKNEKVKSNPLRKVLLPKTSKSLPHYLELNQTEALLEDAHFSDDLEGSTQRLIIELLYQTGMRRAELIHLLESDIDFSRNELRILGKGNKLRIVPANPALLKDIKEYMSLKRKIFEQPIKYLLSLNSGKQLYDQYVYRTVKKHLNGISTLSKKSPHLLRHTFASQLLNNGAELMAIKDLLGHSSLAATQVYTHLNIERLKEVYKKAHPKS
jgi:integrase/recombinase XerC